MFHGGLRLARFEKNKCFMVGDALLDLKRTDVLWWVMACSSWDKQVFKRGVKACLNWDKQVFKRGVTLA
jgi:hypothetical protein